VSPLLYRYPPHWTGFLSAVAFAWKDKSATFTRQSADDAPSFLPQTAVPEATAMAARRSAGRSRLGAALPGLLYDAWCSEWEHVDDDLSATMHLAFARNQCPIVEQRTDLIPNKVALILEPPVLRAAKASAYCGKVAHLYLGILRFVRVGEVYAADLEPECDILPSIAEHFHRRFLSHKLLIRDLRRRRAIVSQPEGWHLAELGGEPIPPLPKHGEFETLWRGYFQNISNPLRENKNLQRNFIPLKVRGHMTEFL
jgi:probable DNA metabolism protein